ncbi:MAG: ABC transporter permease [Synergistota bacterium]|jgi:peptide/nickel transport system permease protein|nr:ABC transporter permease [Synergistota bacterium]OPZ40802.1 MAG: Dipeptide transport system permease protein DppB [Synergistetes bacterium ADurb.BinA166]
MSYWARRVSGAALVLGMVLALNFALFRMMPGDPVTSVMDPDFSPEARERLRQVYGLDRPLYAQFALYVKSTLSFDFGVSFLTGRPVADELRSRVPNTAALLGTSLLLSASLGTWLGMKAALRRGSLLERCVLWSGALSFSFPSFFVQLVLLMALASALPLFPLRGSLSVPPPEGGWGFALDYVHHLALPVLSLTLLGFGGWAIYVRNLAVKVMGEDFILMARARGLPRRRILLGHVFRTMLPTLLTLLLMSLPGVVSGAVITETVFSLHGVGRFLLEAVTGHDYPAAGAAFFLLSLLTVACNLLADLLYSVVDPRVRLDRSAR